MTGVVFNIQHFSVHDGPGIRTTVFMKGCPLRCQWCHNPEGLSRQVQVQYFEDQCIDCGTCSKEHSASHAQICPAKALKVCGQELDVEAVLTQVLKDRAYYADNGGITLSGGECLLQADFASQLLARAKAVGLHTAIDTSGCVAWDAVEKTLAVCDLYLYDIKCIDPALHRAYTGADNRIILENLKKLDACKKEIWIRIPLIPGFNDTPKEMDAIASFVAALTSVTQVTLMPYHTLGASKYKTLGLEYPYDTAKRISQDQLDTFRGIFRNRGIELT